MKIAVWAPGLGQLAEHIWTAKLEPAKSRPPQDRRAALLDNRHRHQLLQRAAGQELQTSSIRPGSVGIIGLKDALYLQAHCLRLPIAAGTFAGPVDGAVATTLFTGLL